MAEKVILKNKNNEELYPKTSVDQIEDLVINPEAEAEESLSKLQLGDTIYSIEGGGDSDLSTDETELLNNMLIHGINELTIEAEDFAGFFAKLIVCEGCTADALLDKRNYNLTIINDSSETMTDLYFVDNPESWPLEVVCAFSDGSTVSYNMIDKKTEQPIVKNTILKKAWVTDLLLVTPLE